MKLINLLELLWQSRHVYWLHMSWRVFRLGVVIRSCCCHTAATLAPGCSSILIPPNFTIHEILLNISDRPSSSSAIMFVILTHIDAMTRSTINGWWFRISGLGPGYATQGGTEENIRHVPRHDLGSEIWPSLSKISWLAEGQRWLHNKMKLSTRKNTNLWSPTYGLSLVCLIGILEKPYCNSVHSYRRLFHCTAEECNNCVIQWEHHKMRGMLWLSQVLLYSPHTRSTPASGIFYLEIKSVFKGGRETFIVL